MFLSDFFTSSGMDENPTAYLFKWQHITYILASVFMFFLLMRIFVHRSEKTRRIFVLVCGTLMLLLKYGGEALFIHEWNLYGDQLSTYSHPFWDFRTFISFQICGINNVLLPLVIWFNLKPMKDFVFTSSIIGGFAAIIYPVGVLYGDPFVITFPMIRTLIVHFLLVFLPCFLMATGEFRLERENWKNTFAGVLIVIAFAMFGNLFVDTDANNMYLMVNPFYGGPIPLLNILPNGVHTLVLFTLVFIAYLILYKLADIYNRKRDRKMAH